MVLYNVTANIDSEVEDQWVAWMKNEHIPKMLETGYFTDHKFLKLLNEIPEAQGSTYAVQYFSPSMDQLQTYFDNAAENLRKEHVEKFGDRCVTFRTILEEV